MVAKDTMMNDLQITRARWKQPERRKAVVVSTMERNIATRQAEITWPIAFKAGHQEGIRKAVKVYEPYIKALEDENSSLVGLASVHGWRSSQVELGEECRRRIKAMKQAFLKERGL